MILSHSLAQILVALVLTLLVVPDISAEATTRIGNSRTTSIKINNNKHTESRLGNGRTTDQKQPSRKISSHLVGNG
ncbi:MAG: hypothetical protein V7L22_19040 [Nostoc sp.]|uniref:hypothetical protein n=1 Tax=Nostoc sp. TaxID=1180 RepID=UPI002FF61332